MLFQAFDRGGPVIHPAPLHRLAEQVRQRRQLAVDRGRFGFAANSWFPTGSIGPHNQFATTLLLVPLHIKRGDLG
jgi:hypothetical protein